MSVRRTDICRWLDTTGPTDVARYKYGYDRASNPLWREDTVATANSKQFDELYEYDGLYRLHEMGRGTLNSGHSTLDSTTFAQCWTLDETGNWSQFRSDNDGNGSWDLEQQRTANPVNEITGLTPPSSPPGYSPTYDPAGNMARIPSTTPASGLTWPTMTVDEWDTLTVDEWDTLSADGYEIGRTFTYDPWNRLVTVSDAGDLIQTNTYDGRNYRILRVTTADASTGAETRHFYYSAGWQSLEERLGASSDPERQYVWGLRYIDDCVLRDRDTDANGTLDERFYPTQDANWNVTALVDDSGTVQERYAYSSYGVPAFLTPSFGSRASSDYDWQTLFCSYRQDPALKLFAVRYRTYHPELGTWLQRDPVGYRDGINLYQAYFVPASIDPYGLESLWGRPVGRDSIDPRLMHRGGPGYHCAACHPPTPLRPLRILPECGEGSYDPSGECCENGVAVAKVRLWICRRRLDNPQSNWPHVHPVGHSFVCCKDPNRFDNTNGIPFCFGKQPRPYGQPGLGLMGLGYVEHEPNPVDPAKCEVTWVCPAQKQRQCQRGWTESPYYTLEVPVVQQMDAGLEFLLGPPLYSFDWNEAAAVYWMKREGTNCHSWAEGRSI